MLNEVEFNTWCCQLKLSESSRQIIESIRSSGPSRRVQSHRGNVVGNYPSRKMGITIQFESHRNELARIYQLEHDSTVLEYYDQPPPIELIYKGKSGKQIRHLYTPDFFVLYIDAAGWEECKTEQELIQLAEKMPARYQKDESGKWFSLPAEEYAQAFELSFRLWSGAESTSTFQQNFIWLEDYFGLESHAVESTTLKDVLAVVGKNPGITLAELFSTLNEVTADDIYTLIAIEEIYVDLYTAAISEPQQVKVFANKETALAYTRATEISLPKTVGYFPAMQIAVGASVCWDGAQWQVVNIGTTTTGLLGADKLVELPNAAFDELLQKGKILAPSEAMIQSSSVDVEEILTHTTPQDIIEANRRYEQLQPYLDRESPRCPTRSIQRWRNQYREAEDLYGSGYIGLLPKHSNKGNRGAKISAVVLEFTQKFIAKHYETLKCRSIIRVYESYVAACESHQPKLTPCSRKSFTKIVKKRSGYKQTLKREGRRAAIQKQPIYWELDQTTPRHGARPFEIVHIDHTQLDIELVSSIASLSACHIDVGQQGMKHNLGRPWATFMVDAYSRRLLAVWITYEEPSYRSCMMVLRICVQRFRRFPQSIVVDNGSEFHSHYFEQLLATYVCTKKHRPPAMARFGSVIERLFGTANTQFIYELQGNTQIKRLRRQVTKSVSPESQAIWNLSELYNNFCEWAYEIYDRRTHPALGQSPHDAFATGIALGGNRSHRQVQDDTVFRILTLPAPERGKRKVQSGQGVKIHNIYYWSNVFRDPEIEQSMVDVRYDPFDVGIAYALVKGKWTQCVSNYYQQLKGKSEKEIHLISAELHKRKQQQGRKNTFSEGELVQFISLIESEEKFLEQRLRAADNCCVFQMIEGGMKQAENEHQAFLEVVTIASVVEDESEADEVLEVFEEESIQDLDILEYYGEF